MRTKGAVFVTIFILFSAPAFGADLPCANRLRAFVPIVGQNTDYTCGPACVRSLKRYFLNSNTSEAEVAHLLKTNEVLGTSPSNMIRGLKSSHLKTRVHTSLGIPQLITGLSNNSIYLLLIHLEEEAHWVIATGMDKQKIVIMDPWSKTYMRIGSSELARLWKTELDERIYSSYAIEVFK